MACLDVRNAAKARFACSSNSIFVVPGSQAGSGLSNGLEWPAWLSETLLKLNFCLAQARFIAAKARFLCSQIYVVPGSQAAFGVSNGLEWLAWPSGTLLKLDLCAATIFVQM